MQLRQNFGPGTWTLINLGSSSGSAIDPQYKLGEVRSLWELQLPCQQSWRNNTHRTGGRTKAAKASRVLCSLRRAVWGEITNRSPWGEEGSVRAHSASVTHEKMEASEEKDVPEIHGTAGARRPGCRPFQKLRQPSVIFLLNTLCTVYLRLKTNIPKCSYRMSYQQFHS